MDLLTKLEKRLSNKTVFIALSLVIILAYWGSWNAFFQQDEWAGFGNFYRLQSYGFHERLVQMYLPSLSTGLGHFLPFVPLVNYARYTLFGLSYAPYSIVSLILHALSSFLVYQLALKLTKNRFTSFIGALFFSTAFSGSQAVTWVGTSTPTQGALIFSLLSLYCWVSWLDKNTRKYFTLAILFLLVAIGFKETALYLFVVLPLIAFIKNFSYRIKALFSLFVLAAGYTLLRVVLIAQSSGFDFAVNQTLSLFSSATSRIGELILKGLTQSFLPQNVIHALAIRFDEITFMSSGVKKGTTEYDLFLQKEIIRPGMLIFGAGLILIFLLIAVFKKDKGKSLLISVLFLAASFVPLAFIASGELSAVFLASRNLYIPVAGVALILSSIVNFFKRQEILLVLVVIVALGVHLVNLKSEIKSEIAIGTTRRTILNTIREDYGDLPGRVIFYIESDRSYYGLAEKDKILPFQSGFGQTILVWYYPTEKFSREFYENKFLWEILDEGYKETNGRGFGFYRNLDVLQSDIEMQGINPDEVIAFAWDGEIKELHDISREVKGKLESNEQIQK